MNRDENCPLFRELMTKSVTFLHLGQWLEESGWRGEGAVGDKYAGPEIKKTAIAVFFHFISIRTVYFCYQNFHQGLLLEVPVCFTLLVEVVPVAWPVTLSFRLPFSS